MCYETEYRYALEAAVQAGEYLKGLGQVAVDSQDGRDIKLAADRKSEELILDILRPSGIPVLSEERGDTGTGQDVRKWIVDPLDGTANFWKGMRDLACVSIALWDGERPMLGVVNRFHRQEIYIGIVGVGAWMNGEAIHPSQVSRKNDAVLATGFPVKRDYGKDSLSAFISKIQDFKKIRMLGAAAIMGTFVADGRVDAYTEEQIMLWDIAAASAIVKAAGGVAEVLPLDDNQCVCRLFANHRLYDDYMTGKG